MSERLKYAAAMATTALAAVAICSAFVAGLVMSTGSGSTDATDHGETLQGLLSGGGFGLLLLGLPAVVSAAATAFALFPSRKAERTIRRMKWTGAGVCFLTCLVTAVFVSLLLGMESTDAPSVPGSIGLGLVFGASLFFLGNLATLGIPLIAAIAVSSRFGTLSEKTRDRKVAGLRARRAVHLGNLRNDEAA